MHAIVTGGASGIGKASALRLGRRMPVTVADRNLAGARRTATEIAAAGGRAQGVEVDVSNRESVAAMALAARAQFGPVTALFANAGINIRNTVDRIEEEDWDHMMAVHVKGVMLCCQAVEADMVAQGGGAIVATSSDFAIMGVAGNATYTAAKTAIYAVVKCMALELAPQKIRVNAVGPGPIDTPLLATGRTPEQHAATKERFARTLPLGRMGRPEEVAFVVDYLLSERSSYVNGQLVHPNGGQLMW